MKKPLLEIHDLAVSVDDKLILNGVDLSIQKGELHVLMGPNGTGKSTLVSAVMGDPRYAVESGSISFDGKDITDESADARARLGVFLSFQAPEEIPGITLENFLRTAAGAIEGKPMRVLAFQKKLKEQMQVLGMDESYASRYLNVGFSGGEKKKAEILQLLMLRPKLAMLDETDSGLDVDAVKTVSKGIRAYHDEGNSILIITHNAKILEELDVDYVHILENGRITRTGGRELADEILQTGFGALQKEAADA
ncbi:MAG: Fe-S cluster assembly ATP-binding protein [Clostridiales bacterium]|jgi:Fe-S cluster assembly ATP-binding protein|nr:Fe-S cluster assembly ATPase SufC [Pygmaiobacter sp.]MDK2813255.1 Fe-S cluster assembly ATP-binding protein [Clostridiales bacterium]